MLAFAVLGLGLTTTAYADTVMLPELSTEHVSGVNVFTTYQSDNRYTVNIQVQYQVENQLQVPDTITYFSIDGSQLFTIPLKEEFVEANNPSVVEGSSTPLTEEEVKALAQLERLAEKRAELAAERDQFYPVVKTCLEEFKQDNPIAYEGWFRTANLEDWQIPTKVPQSSNLSYHELIAKKQYEACLHMKNFGDIGLWEAHKIIDHVEPQSLDDTDSPHTVEVTEQDIINEANRAAALAKHYTDPYQDWQGAVLQGPDVSVESKMDLCQKVHWSIEEDGEFCPLKDYNEVASQEPEDPIAKAQQIMCETYLPAPDEANYKSAWENRMSILEHCPFIELPKEE